MKKLLFLMFLLFGTVAISAQEIPTLKIITYDSFYISDAVIDQFEAEHNVTVEILRLADAGVLVNESILTVGNPLGDVLYGIDNTFLSRALDNDLFIPYESPLLADVPEEFQLDMGEFRVTPVQYGDVCLNFDVSQFTSETAPQSLADLTDPRFEGMLVVQNPATSSPGLAFLLATIVVFGEEGDYTYLDFWSDLADNGVLAVAGWSEAYYGEFSIAGGDYPLVVSYATSPLAELYYSDFSTDILQYPPALLEFVDFAGLGEYVDRLTGERLVTVPLLERYDELQSRADSLGISLDVMGVEPLPTIVNPLDGFPFRTVMTGEALQAVATAFENQSNSWIIQFQVKPEYQSVLSEYTTRAMITSEPLGIVLNGRLLSAPSIRDRIDTSGVISGGFTQEEAEELAFQLRLQAQPIPFTTGAVVADETCFRQIEFMGILNGAQNQELAQQFIDFALSTPFQEDIPLNMWVLPVNSTATLPDLYLGYASIPENPLSLDYALIEEKRDEWLQAWAETVLR